MLSPSTFSKFSSLSDVVHFLVLHFLLLINMHVPHAIPRSISSSALLPLLSPSTFSSFSDVVSSIRASPAIAFVSYFFSLMPCYVHLAVGTLLRLQLLW